MKITISELVKKTIERIVKKVEGKNGISKPASHNILRYTFSVNCIKKGIFARVFQSLSSPDRLPLLKFSLTYLQKMPLENF